MEVPRHWRNQKARYALVGVVCDQCHSRAFPPRMVCQSCGSTQLSEHQFSGLGEVYSYSTIYQGPNGYSEYLPYVVALVRLEEGPLVASQLTDTDPEQRRIGLPVEMVTRKLAEDGPGGIVVYGYKFRPRLSERPLGA